MQRIISIPQKIDRVVRAHLFQSNLEQGAFLMANVELNKKRICFDVVDVYLVPKEGWQVQHEVYLEMKDSERAKIMNLARQGGYAVIDCHSHPDSDSRVAFSPSDRLGITDFAAYAKWKLDGKPFAAMVWGERSVDAVIWWGDFLQPELVDEVQIRSNPIITIKPQGSWQINKPRPWWGRIFHGK